MFKRLDEHRIGVKTLMRHDNFDVEVNKVIIFKRHNGLINHHQRNNWVERISPYLLVCLIINGPPLKVDNRMLCSNRTDWAHFV